MSPKRHPPLVVLMTVVVVGLATLSAQPSRRAPGAGVPPAANRGDDGGSSSLMRLEGGGFVDEETVHTAREIASHSSGTPNWSNPAGFERDVFTFARIIFRSGLGQRGGFMRGGYFGWTNDFPDSDLNLSYRLQQMTSLMVDPDGRVVRLTERALADYPFVYMVKPGRLELRDSEVPAFRKYLLNGGALMADDFWGDAEWKNFEHEMQRVLPERRWIELPMEHPVFHSVFELRPPKESLQVPPIHSYERTGSSSRNGDETREMHVRTWLDDKGRIMIIAIHNSDTGDGWEREGENSDYFHKFSEARAYPLGINIVFYLMTH